MPSRPLLLPLLAAAALGLSACTGGSDPFAVAGTVALPDGTGGSAFAGSDAAGRVLLVGSDADSATVTVVDGDVVVSTTEVALPDRTSVTAVREGELLFGELTDDGFVLHVADAGTGALTGDRPVTPFPADAGVTTTGVPTPQGLLLLAVPRAQAVPELLLVDPATGSVTASVALDLGELVDPARLADWSQSVDVKGVVASPDGSAYAVALTVLDHETGRPTGVLAVVDGPDLAPVTAPLVPAPGSDWGSEPALSVADDGTAHAFLVRNGERVLAEVAPGAAEAATVAELEDVTHSLVVRDGVAWVVYTDDPVRVTRIDLASGGSTSSVELCATGSTGQLAAADGGGVWFSSDCADDVLWRFDAEPLTAGAGR